MQAKADCRPTLKTDSIKIQQDSAKGLADVRPQWLAEAKPHLVGSTPLIIEIIVYICRMSIPKMLIT